MRRVFTLIATLAAVGLFATSALAAAPTITGDGTYFLGKGDVQTAFGWNNSQAQQRLADVTYSYELEQATTWNCVKVVELGNGGENEIVQQRSNSLTSAAVSVVGTERTRNQITGIWLDVSGFDSQADGPDVGSCPATPSGFVFDAGSLVEGALAGGLWATWNGTTVLIP